MIKKYYQIFFIFILPLLILLDIFCLGVRWNADNYYQGNKYSTELSGFPFADQGAFHEMNGMSSSGDSTINWSIFLVNKLIELSLAALIYFFLIRKISFTSKARIIVLTIIVTFIYSKAVHYFFWYSANWYGGLWPEKIELKNIRYALDLVFMWFCF